jgi:hypothetical protein
VKEMPMKETTVYVLGAGCSVNYGYPLASGFIPALESFSQSLADNPNTEKLKRSVDETVTLMRRANVRTIDALALRVHQGKLDDPKENPTCADGTQNRQILDAKIATAALFLKIEQTSANVQLDSYDRLILKLFPGTGGWHERIRNANCHLLSFNYDRLFETTLLRNFSVDTGANLLYGERILNSGLHHNCGETMGFEVDRFSFLKLHGSIGMRVHENHFGLRYYPYFDGKLPGEAIALDDQRFFGRSGNHSPFERDPQPLIAFPFEKDFVRSGQQNRLPFRAYIESVWKRAEQIVASATEIRFIGYSFHEMDHQSVIGLLKRAGLCQKIVIQNRPGESEQICSRLRVDHGIRIPLEPYGCEF